MVLVDINESAEETERFLLSRSERFQPLNVTKSIGSPKFETDWHDALLEISALPR